MIPTSVDPIFGLNYPSSSQFPHEARSPSFGYRQVQQVETTSLSLCTLARFGAFVPARALAWATTSLIHGVFKTLSWAAEVASSEETKMKRAVSLWSNQHLNQALDFIRYPSPYILETIHCTSKKLEESALALKLHLSSGIETTYPRSVQQQEPTEMAKILEQIGPQVVSRGIFLETFQTIGRASSQKLADVGTYTTASLQALSRSSLGSYLASTLNTTARGLEVLMILPYGPDLLASFLQKGGLPVAQIEKLFSNVVQSKAAQIDFPAKDETLSQVALSALDALNEFAITKEVKESMGIGQGISDAISWGVPMISWLFVSSHTMIVLPFLAQRVLPHLLRSGAAFVDQKTEPLLRKRQRKGILI